MCKKSNKRGEKVDNLFLSNNKRKEEKTKSKFKKHKEQTIQSLNEVENFLNQTQKAIRHFKLYKILK